MGKKHSILTKDFLNLHYIKNNKSIADLSIELNISKASIYRAIKKFKIDKDSNKIQESRIKNFEKTNIEKYGVKNTASLKSTKEKIKQTNIEKYGHGCCLLNENIKDKARKTNIDKYGVNNPMKNHEFAEQIVNSIKAHHSGIGYGSQYISQKIYNTTQDRHGEKHIMQTRDGLEGFKNTMLQKYGVENPSKLNEVIKKRIDSRIQNKTSLSIDGKSIRSLAEENHVPYDFLIRRVDGKTTLNDLVNISLDYKNNVTNIESVFSDQLYISRYNNFYDLDKFPNLRYRPDFKFENGTAVNVDGLYWHSELKQPNKWYHFEMRKEYEKRKLRIFQFREDEILYKMHIVKSMILNNLGKSNKIFARKTDCVLLSQKEASDFLIKTHIMGDIKSRHIGLKYNNELVMIMSYKIQNKVCKIDRVSSKCNTVVVGGFSKLLKFLENKNSFDFVHYWVDLRYGTGDFLEKAGFSKSRETLGWKWTNFKNTYNRLQCRANMNERKLSQAEYADELGWCKIYDAGQRLWIKKYINTIV